MLKECERPAAYKGLYKLRWNETHIVALVTMCRTNEVRSRACFYSDQSGFNVCRIGQQLLTREFLQSGTCGMSTVPATSRVFPVHQSSTPAYHEDRISPHRVS